MKGKQDDLSGIPAAFSGLGRVLLILPFWLVRWYILGFVESPSSAGTIALDAVLVLGGWWASLPSYRDDPKLPPPRNRVAGALYLPLVFATIFLVVDLWSLFSGR